MDYIYARKRSCNRRYLYQIEWMALRSYPLEVFAGNTMIWSGDTNKSLGYVHLNVEKPVRSKQITIRLKGNTSDQDAFGQITEVAAKAANDMELEAKANKNNANLRIIEIEFLEAIK